MTPSPRKNLDFKIELLSGNNVVYVQCSGFESELFMPQIIKGRISFQNILPNRRCCSDAALSTCPIIFKHKVDGKVSVGPVRNGQEVLKLVRNQGLKVPASAGKTKARTTPVAARDKENVPVPGTPEQHRGNYNASSNFDDVLICHVTPQVYSPESHTSTLHDFITLSPDLMPRNDATVPSVLTANGELLDEAFQQNRPIRTYSRRKSSNTSISNKSKCSTSWSPQNKKKNVATKPPNAPFKVEVKKRKLVVDPKKSLQSCDPNKLVNVPINKKKIAKKLVTAKTRRDYEALKDACKDKTTTALPNYAEVGTVQPLQFDHQVKVLISKRKKLERRSVKSAIAKAQKP